MFINIHSMTAYMSLHMERKNDVEETKLGEAKGV
jgi:hypothetical protein